MNRVVSERLIRNNNLKVKLLLLLQCRAAIPPHRRTLEVRPGRISKIYVYKIIELNYG